MPKKIYGANMAAAPAGWLFTHAMWAWGVPTGAGGDPTGFGVIGTVIAGTGLYPEPVSTL